MKTTMEGWHKDAAASLAKILAATKKS
jgi:hypothetical protein